MSVCGAEISRAVSCRAERQRSRDIWLREVGASHPLPDCRGGLSAALRVSARLPASVEMTRKEAM
jgi:hypothetical protein